MNAHNPSKIVTVFIASDHAGLELKSHLIKSIKKVKWIDLGPTQPDRVDYPDYANKLCMALKNAQSKAKSTETVAKPSERISTRGILICGSGIGMSIAANRHAHIRAALVENTSVAKLSREHNDSNVLCLGARFLAIHYAAEITKAWLETPFSNDVRHLGRLQKLKNNLQKSPEK